MESFDIAVIGGGTAGLTAATVAAAGGKTVALIEEGRLGGECTWSGCVPSRALTHAARVRRNIERAAQFGIHADSIRVNFPAVMGYIRNLIDTIAGFEDAQTLQRKGVAVRQGRARFVDRSTLALPEGEIRARRIIICTGTRPLIPAIAGIAEVPYLTTETVFDLDALPAHLIVVGAGPTGLEIGQAFCRLGSRVTIVDRENVLLPLADADIQAFARTIMERDGVEVALGVEVDRVQYREGVYRLTITREGRYGTVAGEALLLATGYTPNTSALNLDAAGVEMNRRGIGVDDRLRTSAPSIYAAGSVTGMYDYTHVAAYQARIAAQNAAGGNARADYRVVPAAIFTDPPIAGVGLTEEAARRRHGEIQVAVLPYTGIDRAVIERDLPGLIKIITGKKTTAGLSFPGFVGGGDVLGAHVAGAGADEVIHEFALAMQTGMLAGRLAQTLHVYPTLSLGVQQTVGLLFPQGRATIDLRQELDAEV